MSILPPCHEGAEASRQAFNFPLCVVAYGHRDVDIQVQNVQWRSVSLLVPLPASLDCIGLFIDSGSYCPCSVLHLHPLSLHIFSNLSRRSLMRGRPVYWHPSPLFTLCLEHLASTYHRSRFRDHMFLLSILCWELLSTTLHTQLLHRLWMFTLIPRFGQQP